MRETRAAFAALLVAAVAGGIASQLVPVAWATRNSAGTHSLPSGNPVVTGTTISSTVVNNTLSDLSAEITSSLDRSGRGAMLAPLQCTNGTVALPSVTFATDPDTGLYRVATNDIAVTAGGVKVFDCLATGCTFPLLGASTGVFSTAAGITATQSTTNGTGVTATGNGTGTGVSATGGSSNGNGVRGVGGATNGEGGSFLGAGTGHGVDATGGNTNNTTYGGVFTGGATSGGGVKGVGGAPNGTGGVFDGTGTGKGITVGTGYAFFNGSNPASTTGFTNTVTAANIIKSWGVLTTDGAGNVAVTKGFNIASVACGGTGNDDIIVTMTTGLSTAEYPISVNTVNASGTWADNTSATVFHIRNAGKACDTTAGWVAHFQIVGLQ